MVFQFKQFSVCQSESAMKIGTDNVLLGAWTPIENHPRSILDIGAGTGILALMLAQRTSAQTIDAIEIDENAYIECTNNFENSPWADRLFCYFASFDEFVEEMLDEPYDLIISNPPFYTSNYRTNQSARNKARFEDSLPFPTLIEGVSKLLSANGTFSVIIPFAEEGSFIELAQQNNLFPNKITRVRGNETSDVKRSLITFIKTQPVTCPINELVIEKERNVYTNAYVALTKDFYLKM